MAEPCTQAEVIGGMRATLVSLDEKMERHDAREERMLSALESVASQGKSIEFLVETAHDHKKSFREAFDRLRELENPVGSPLQVKIWASSAGGYFFAFFIVGSGIAIFQNWAVAAGIWKFFRG